MCQRRRAPGKERSPPDERPQLFGSEYQGWSRAAGARRRRLGEQGAMAALLLLPLLLPLLPLLPPHLWPRWRWLAADLAFAVRAHRCKRALQARAQAAAAADPRGPEG